jgi:hypothetical protein
MVTSTLKFVQNRAVGQITVVELDLVGYSYSYLEYDAQNPKPKVLVPVS